MAQKNQQIRQAIEQGIREHLVITNEPGIKYTVDKIMKLLPKMWSDGDMKNAYDDGWAARGTEEGYQLEKWFKQYEG